MVEKRGKECTENLTLVRHLTCMQVSPSMCNQKPKCRKGIRLNYGKVMIQDQSKSFCLAPKYLITVDPSLLIERVSSFGFSNNTFCNCFCCCFPFHWLLVLTFFAGCFTFLTQTVGCRILTLICELLTVHGLKYHLFVLPMSFSLLSANLTFLL